VDQGVTEPSAYVISNNQEEYAYIGAKWLFEQIGGEATSSTCAARRRLG
jgi:ribose transport system substrate-binding protein